MIFWSFIAFHTVLSQIALKIPDDALINQVTAVISSSTQLLLANPCSDRANWNNPSRRKLALKHVQIAESLFNTPLPPWSDDLYLQYTSTKDKIRVNGEKMMDDRSNRLLPFAIAECHFNSGNYTAKLNQELREIASQKSWSFPAHGMHCYFLNGIFILNRRSINLL